MTRRPVGRRIVTAAAATVTGLLLVLGARTTSFSPTAAASSVRAPSTSAVATATPWRESRASRGDDLDEAAVDVVSSANPGDRLDVEPDGV